MPTTQEQQFYADLILTFENEKRTDRMRAFEAKLGQAEGTVTPFSTYQGPEAGTSDDDFLKDTQALREIPRKDPRFITKLNQFRRKHQPTMFGTNAGDAGRWKSIQKEFGKDAAIDLLLNINAPDPDTARNFKQKELEHDEKWWKKRIGAKQWDSFEPGTRAAFISVRNNIKGSEQLPKLVGRLKKARSDDDAATAFNKAFGPKRASQVGTERLDVERGLLGNRLPSVQSQPADLSLPQAELPQESFQTPSPSTQGQFSPSIDLPVPESATAQTGSIALPTEQPVQSELTPDEAQRARDEAIFQLFQEQEQADADRQVFDTFQKEESQLNEQAAPIQVPEAAPLPTPSAGAQEQAFQQPFEIKTPGRVGPTQGDIQNMQTSTQLPPVSGVGDVLSQFVSSPLETISGITQMARGLNAPDGVAAPDALEVGAAGALGGATFQAARPALTAIEAATGIQPSDIITQPGLVAPALLATGVEALQDKNFIDAYKKVGNKKAAAREQFAAVDIVSDILGSLPTGAAVAKLAQKGLSVLGFSNQLNRLAKFDRVIQKGRAAIKGGNISLDRARQVYATVQSAVRQKALETILPKIGAGVVAGGAGTFGRSIVQDIEEGKAPDIARAKELAKTGAVFGAGFGATVGALPVVGSALSRAPRKVNPTRFAEEQRILEDVSDFVSNQVNQSVRVGRIKPQEAASTASQMVLDGLTERGVHIGEHISFGTGGKFLRNMERANMLDKVMKTDVVASIDALIKGTFKKANLKADVGAQVAPVIKKLEKSGMTPQQITRALRYFETSEGGEVVFNALGRGGKNIRAPWQASSVGRAIPQLSAEQAQGLSQLRQFFNGIDGQFGRFSEKLGQRRVQGYVPLYTKQFVSRGEGGSNLGGIFEPGPAKARGAVAGFDSRKHEDNIYKLIDIYSSQLAKHEAFVDVVPKVTKEFHKLQLLGDTENANWFFKTAMRAMGIKTEQRGSEILGKMYGTQIAQANQGLLQGIQNAVAPNKTNVVDKVLDVLHSSTFSNLLFTNPKTMLKQSVQTPLVGAGELGLKWVGLGNKSWTLKDKAGKLAADMMPYMRAKDPSVLREAVLQEGTDFRTAKKVMGLIGKPGEYLFNKLDVRNRGTAFAGAYRQFKDGIERGMNPNTSLGRATLSDVMDGMLSGEQSLIMNAWKRGGDEAAARMYGIVRSRRINFAYSIADTPEIFAEGLGRFVPFTTWSTNMLMRTVGDINERNIGTLAKRIALPTAYLAAFRSLTGVDLPNAEPYTAIPGAFAFQAIPAVTGPAKEFILSGPASAIREATKFTPVGPIMKIGKDLADATSSSKSRSRRGALNALGLKEIDREDPIQVLIPQLLREAVTKPEKLLPGTLRGVFGGGSR